jgi:3-hydroxybutyryl-CoA dehydratase
MAHAVAAHVSELWPGQRVLVDFRVSHADMANFAALSGDYNPLHTDDDFARGKGFQGRVVYAGILVSKVSRLIGMQLPGRDSVWASLALDFRQPLYVDEPAQLEGLVDKFSDSAGIVLLKLVMRSGEKLLARGKAEVAIAR